MLFVACCAEERNPMPALVKEQRGHEACIGPDR